VIEESAAQLFAERGYEATTLDAIAEAAGVTRAVVYDHFASKADLHVALLAAETERLLGYVGDAVAHARASPEEQLRAGVSAFFAFVEEHPFAWRMIFRDPPADSRIAEAHRRLQERATTTIAGLLGAAARSEGVAATGAEVRLKAFAEMLKVAQNSLAARWWDDRSLRREDLVEWVMAFAWGGLARALVEAPRAPSGGRTREGGSRA